MYAARKYASLQKDEIFMLNFTTYSAIMLSGKCQNDDMVDSRFIFNVHKDKARLSKCSKANKGVCGDQNTYRQKVNLKKMKGNKPQTRRTRRENDVRN